MSLVEKTYCCQDTVSRLPPAAQIFSGLSIILLQIQKGTVLKFDSKRLCQNSQNSFEKQ